MNKLLREYGLIIILIVVAMVGYLVVRGNEEDILARSLDGIRNRLVAMVDDVASREAIAAHFDRFKGKVLAKEVSPEDVEHVAANVLNLSNSGSTITLEQAELMLDMASSVSEATLLPTPAPPEPSESDPTPPAVVAPPTPPDAPGLSQADGGPDAPRPQRPRRTARNDARLQCGGRKSHGRTPGPACRDGSAHSLSR